MWPFKKNNDKEMEELRLKLKSGEIKSEDLDDETADKFIEYMNKRTQNTLNEIAKIEEETKKIEEETEQIKEETRVLEEENRQLDIENKELDRQITLLKEIGSNYVNDLIDAIKYGDQDRINSMNAILKERVLDVVGEEEYNEVMNSLQSYIEKNK